MKYTKYKNGAYNIHLINTDRFKTISVRINFKRKVNRNEVTKRNLLTRVLLESNEFYGTSRLIEIETEKLFGLMLRSSSTISGNYSVMSFESSFLNDNYTNSSMLSNAFDFILGFIFNPDVVSNKFNEKSFNMCFESLKQEILSIRENPNRYGMLRMLEEMDGSAPYSICADGNIDDLNEITSSSLYDYYKEVIKSDLIDIFVIGDFDFLRVKEIINNKFRINTLKRPAISHYIKHNKINRKVKVASEVRPLEQSKLYIGCKLDNLTPFEQKYVMNIYSFILGGSPYSKLFSVLREKNSLCYNVSSIYNPVFNLLIIKAGIDASCYKKCVNLIKQELKNMEKGLFGDDEINAGIITYKNTFKEVLDSAFSILNAYTSCEYLGYDPIDERIRQIDKVDRSSIMDVCKKIHMDTIFLLEGDSND